MAHEQVFEPPRWLRCSALMPGRDNRDRKGHSPKTPLSLRGGGSRPDGQAVGGRLDRRARAPLRDAIGMARTFRHTSGFEQRTDGREPARRNGCADGSDATNPRPNAAPNRIRHEMRDGMTAYRECEGIPRENPAAPTALVLGHRHGPFAAPRRL